MSFLKDLGEDTSKIEEYINNAKNALNTKELEKVKENINECTSLIDSLSKSLAERAYDSAKEAAEEASKVKIDLEKNGIIELLNKAAESLKNKNYQEVVKYTADVHTKVKELKEKVNKGQELIKRLSNRIEHLKEEGLPTKDIEKILNQATKNLEDNEFDIGMQSTGTKKTVTVKPGEDFSIECAIHPNMLLEVSFK